MDGTNLKSSNVIETKYVYVKELSKQLTGDYDCTRALLEQLNYNLVSGQTSSVGDNFDSYEIRINKLVRNIDLLESDLNQYFNK